MDMFVNALLDDIFMREWVQNDAKMTSKTIQKSIRNLMMFSTSF